ncbi:MAG: DNA mismatch repair endonuclease MutL [Clostridiales bacterium]|nr:DNA mismatch repair endonuclease MutL [Clostridiales bacterium]
MKKIAVLDKNTIDKIAAGEVVERPASVVKELVENAIDAGATAVTVEITDGGKKSIRITDNGSGIEAAQVPVAFLRHATSKIEKAEDLTHIASLGFRGEALSSIAAVAQVELITKTPSSLSGTRYLIEGGEEKLLEETGAPDGTTFLVRNLFYNTPARSKFLKSDMAEANYIGTMMEQLALSHPEISFKYIQNRQVKLYSSGNYSVRDVIYSIYGKDITRSLLEVSCENDFMRMTGFVGKPEISRGNRSFENYYINGRFVKNNVITKAIEDGYKGFLMQHKFPFVSLRIEMDGNDLDVNVHPSKMEVRFARGPEVYTAVRDAVHQALTGREMIPGVSVGKEEKTSREPALSVGAVPEPFEIKRRDALKNGTAGTRPERLGENLDRRYPGKENLSPGKDTLRDGNSSMKNEVPGRESFSSRKETSGKRIGSSEMDAPGERRFSSGKDAPKGENYSSGGDLFGEESPALRRDSSEGSVFSDEEEKFFSGTLASRQAAETAKGSDAPQEETEKQPETLWETSAASGDSVKETGEDSGDVSPEDSQTVAKDQTGTEEPVQLDLFQENFLSEKARSRHRLIGQLFETYWLVEYEDRFYIIDQHAAHEKVWYERFVRLFREQTAQSQYLSPGIIVSLSMEEEQLLKANMEYFQGYGFSIENYGGREYCIQAVPTNLYGMTEEELFLEMLDHLAGEGSRNALEIFTSRLATMACRAAVKGKHKMSAEEANRLIDELLTLDNPFHCPHGRPTIISMTRTEIEKKFKRIL